MKIGFLYILLLFVTQILCMCGDTNVDVGEECDDGNLMLGDGCDDLCQTELGWDCMNNTCVTICGDGLARGNEPCDDGNSQVDDGCADCVVESHWTCDNSTNICSPTCGDGILVGDEVNSTTRCDDGNLDGTDGCDSNCAVEFAFSCSGEPSVCFPCGDSIISLTEDCDDGNSDPGDGCSEQCQIEQGWICFQTGTPCLTLCGDGLIRGEEFCDDQNRIDGDGCSATCNVESGFVCTVSEPSVCESNSNASDDLVVIIVPVVIAVVFVCVCVLAALLGFFLWNKNKRQNSEPKEHPLSDIPTDSPQPSSDQNGYEKTPRSSVHVSELQTQKPSQSETKSISSEYLPLLHDVQIGELIGSGNFGTVYMGHWQGVEVALKKLKQGDFNEFQNEIHVMSTVKHPNIVAFFGIYRHEDFIYIASEFMPFGDLASFLRNSDKTLSEKILIEMCLNVANGMTHLHSQKIIHRDLACRNLLIGSNNIVKITDFGLSRSVESTNEYYRTTGAAIPIRWTSPEAIDTGKFNKASDVWSYGVVIWEIFSQAATPYEKMSMQDVVTNVMKGYRLPAPEKMPEQIASIMIECWKEPDERPDFPAITKQLLEFKKNQRETQYVTKNNQTEYSLPPQHN